MKSSKMANVTLNSASQMNKSGAHDALVRQTQKWVGMTFYGTLLKQVRNEPFRSDTLDGGEGGKMFGSMLDQQLSTRMSRGKGDKLVNAIVNHIEKNSSFAQRNAAAAYGAQARVIPPGGSTFTSPAATDEQAVPAVGSIAPTGDSTVPADGSTAPTTQPSNKVRIYVAPGFGT